MRFVMRAALGSVVLLVLGAACFGGASQARRQKPEVIVVPAGTRVPALGLAFDVSYDPATDRVVPGYRILQVGINNNSINVVQLDARVDQWAVVDRRGRTRVAILSLRQSDPDAWVRLPVRLRQLLQYPLLVSPGITQSVDLLFPNGVILDEFKEVHFKSAGVGKFIKIIAQETTE